MKALVIFNEVPERARFFILQDPRVDEVLMLENLQGVVVNNQELTEMQDASLDMFMIKINGSEDVIPAWPAMADTEAETFVKDFKINVEPCQPDRIFHIVFLL